MSEITRLITTLKRELKQQGRPEFTGSAFGEQGDTLDFVHDMLTGSAPAKLPPELRQARSRLACLHEESLAQRRGSGLLLALRRVRRSASTAGAGQRSNAPVMAAKNTLI